MPDFSEFFAKYEALAKNADDLFARIGEQFPDCMRCEIKCSDCCHAVFDLSLVEALYLNTMFHKHLSPKERSKILERADEADRKAYKMKKELFRASQSGVGTREILEKAATMRVRCPLLGEDDTCQLYDHRPITCRVYGCPTAIGGQGHTCGKTGFKAGEQYPTVNMDRMQDMLVELSLELTQSYPNKNRDLHTLFVPVSMALLTDYNDEYLGFDPQAPCGTGGAWVIPGADGETDEAFIKAQEACGSCSEKGGDCSPDTCGKSAGPIADAPITDGE